MEDHSSALHHSSDFSPACSIKLTATLLSTPPSCSPAICLHLFPLSQSRLNQDQEAEQLGNTYACPTALLLCLFTPAPITLFLSCLYKTSTQRSQGQELIFCTTTNVMGTQFQLLKSTSAAYVIKCQLAYVPILLLLTQKQHS